MIYEKEEFLLTHPKTVSNTFLWRILLFQVDVRPSKDTIVSVVLEASKVLIGCIVLKLRTQTIRTILSVLTQCRPFIAKLPPIQ